MATSPLARRYATTICAARSITSKLLRWGLRERTTWGRRRPTANSWPSEYPRRSMRKWTRHIFRISKTLRISLRRLCISSRTRRFADGRSRTAQRRHEGAPRSSGNDACRQGGIREDVVYGTVPGFDYALRLGRNLVTPGSVTPDAESNHPLHDDRAESQRRTSHAP